MSKTLKTVTVCLAAVVALAGLVWIVNPSLFRKENSAVNAPATTAVGQLSAPEESFDFGTVSMAAGKVTHRFAITNSSGAPVSVAKLYTSCMCTTASIATKNGRRGPFGMQGMGVIPRINEIINPGETAEVEAVFDPAAHGPAGVGKIRRVVYLETNSTEAPNIQLSFEANVTP